MFLTNCLRFIGKAFSNPGHQARRAGFRASLESLEDRLVPAANYAVTGAIRTEWLGAGGASGYLGNPTMPQKTTGDGHGLYQFFQGGTINWSPATGAHAVHGAIETLWNSLGGSTSVLGYPTSEQMITGDGHGVYQVFQNGTINWSPATGAHDVYGVIETLWNSMGGSTSRLGYPTDNEYNWNGGLRADFQGGYISWTATGGTHVVYNAAPTTNPIPGLPNLSGTWTTTVVGVKATYTLTANGHGYNVSGSNGARGTITINPAYPDWLELTITFKGDSGPSTFWSEISSIQSNKVGWESGGTSWANWTR